jgi:hypothetical protein
LLDRIDLHIEVPQVKFRDISAEQTGETSATIRKRVVAARQRQQARFARKPAITCNARMGPRELKSYCALDETTKELLEIRHGGFEPERARLRPHPQSRAHHRRFGRRGKHRQRPHFRSHPIPLAGPAIVDVN